MSISRGVVFSYSFSIYCAAYHGIWCSVTYYYHLNGYKLRKGSIHYGYVLHQKVSFKMGPFPNQDTHIRAFLYWSRPTPRRVTQCLQTSLGSKGFWYVVDKTILYASLSAGADPGGSWGSGPPPLPKTSKRGENVARVRANVVKELTNMAKDLMDYCQM